VPHCASQYSEFSDSSSISGICSEFGGFCTFRPRRLKFRQQVQMNWQVQLCFSAHWHCSNKEVPGWVINKTLPWVCLPSILVVSLGLSRMGWWWWWWCTLVQALRLCTGRTAHRGSRGIAVLFLDRGTRRGWGVSVTPRPLFTPGKAPVPIV
jgi:hypothetical protein